MNSGLFTAGRSTAGASAGSSAPAPRGGCATFAQALMALTLFMASAAFSAHAAAFPVTKILDNGPDAKRLIWVIMGDGYTSAQMANFRTDAASIVTAMKTAEHWAEYASYINV